MKNEDWDKAFPPDDGKISIGHKTGEPLKHILERHPELSNPKADRHMEICRQMNDTYRIKNEAYGDSFGETYRKLGIISAITRMTDKLNRITALSTGAQNNVKDEAVEDTLIDLANYAIMTKIEIELAKQREESK